MLPNKYKEGRNLGKEEREGRKRRLVWKARKEVGEGKRTKGNKRNEGREGRARGKGIKRRKQIKVIH